MKKNLKVIQIKGIRGLILAGLVVICLAAGFVAFPGLVCMHVWNWVASYFLAVPNIGLIQGVLLWAIMVVAYFVFRKERVVVCVKSPQGLSEEELKMVLADMKKQAQEDPMFQALMKAREAELKYKQASDATITESEEIVNTDSSSH